jgi:hypothetical protein
VLGCARAWRPRGHASSCRIAAAASCPGTSSQANEAILAASHQRWILQRRVHPSDAAAYRLRRAERTRSPEMRTARTTATSSTCVGLVLMVLALPPSEFSNTTLSCFKAALFRASACIFQIRCALKAHPAAPFSTRRSRCGCSRQPQRRAKARRTGIMPRVSARTTQRATPSVHNNAPGAGRAHLQQSRRLVRKAPPARPPCELRSRWHSSGGAAAARSERHSRAAAQACGARSVVPSGKLAKNAAAWSVGGSRLRLVRGKGPSGALLRPAHSGTSDAPASCSLCPSGTQLHS